MVSDTIKKILLSRPKAKTWKGGDPVRIEVKYDGYRYAIGRDLDGDLFAISRKLHNNDINRLRHCPQVDRLIRSTSGPFVVDGEVYVEGGHASDVPTHLAQGGSSLNYRAFALPLYNGEDWRGRTLNVAMAQLERMAPGITPETVPLHLTQDALMNLARTNEWEGFIIKLSHWYSWFKLKPTSTLDAVITEIHEGEGKFGGSLGAVTVSLYDENGDLTPLCRVGGGFSDTERQTIWNLNGKAIGSVIEVVYDKVEARGGLRFPRFMRFRDDEKDPKECTTSQLG